MSNSVIASATHRRVTRQRGASANHSNAKPSHTMASRARRRTRRLVKSRRRVQR